MRDTPANETRGLRPCNEQQKQEVWARQAEFARAVSSRMDEICEQFPEVAEARDALASYMAHHPGVAFPRFRPEDARELVWFGCPEVFR